jgi:hypothetical protein
LRIHGDLVLIFSGDIDGLVWDWKTGEQIAMIVSLLFRPPSDRQASGVDPFFKTFFLDA